MEGLVTTPDGIAIVGAAGDLDMATAPQFEESLVAQAGSTWGVVADLLAVDFADSTGVSALVNAHVACAEHGGHFAIAVTAPRILRVFDITGLCDVLHITDSLEAACGELRRLAEQH